MTATGYLEAVRAELGDNQPDNREQSSAACAWRWNPDNPYVNPEVWEGNEVEITWTPLSGWVLAGLRPDGSVTDRERLELATWAEPDWAAWAVWDALTGHGCADEGSRRVWDGLPGLRTPTELLYVGGPFDGRTVEWRRTEPAAVALDGGSYNGTWWPSGCYVLDHGDVADRSRFLWLGPAPLPGTGRPRTHDIVADGPHGEEPS
ncbi:hypothetical protein ACFV1W_25270 [Kitasatospora sp. NPDC059648]|uniref:hypothetical protein n=1 Tax=Kitasatospora sp. NPDC059648 TaxID=3346894 RepID=UPI00369D6FFE